jgi:hypothetical protein
MAGIIAGSLASEWLVYVTAILFLAARRRLPIRFMKFQKICYDQTVLRPVLQSFQFRKTLRGYSRPRANLCLGTPIIVMNFPEYCRANAILRPAPQ